ncbi:MAG: helix-turn-helix transcriptional regulator [Anaerolineae bacterium]|jgi:predicted DNA-binding transcriptional regulator YafY
MANVATRLLSLIMMLQSRSSWKASELAAELNVSERTIHRYISMLDEMGIPIYSERGRYGGFSLVRGYKLPPLVFTAEEATVLYMGANLVRDVWGHTYNDAATAVTAKLDNVLPDDLRAEVSQLQQYLAVGRLAARDYQPWESTLHTLRQCILDRHCVRLTYKGLNRQEVERVVEPYGLAFKWGQWYLAGFCQLRQDMRTFRVDRIRQAQPLKERFMMPNDFDAREYLQRAMQYETPHRIVVHLDAGIAQSIREWDSNWLEIADDGDDGSIVVRFGTTNLDWAVGWVLSYGSAAHALEPPELVERVRTTAEGVLQRYNGGDANRPDVNRQVPDKQAPEVHSPTADTASAAP